MPFGPGPNFANIEVYGPSGTGADGANAADPGAEGKKDDKYKNGDTIISMRCIVICIPEVNQANSNPLGTLWKFFIRPTVVDDKLDDASEPKYKHIFDFNSSERTTLYGLEQIAREKVRDHFYSLFPQWNTPGHFTIVNFFIMHSQDQHTELEKLCRGLSDASIVSLI